MDPPAESPFSRAQRMFWTVWGYISEAVESVLRPTNTGNNETNSDLACSTNRETYGGSATQSTAREGGQDEKQPTLTASSELKSPQTVVAMEQCNTPIGQGLGTVNVQCSVQHNRGSNSQAEDGKYVTLDEVDLSESLACNHIVLHVTEGQLGSEVEAKKTSHGELCGKEWNHAKKADKNEKVEQSTSEQCLVKNIKGNEIEVVIADDPIRLGVHGEGGVKSKELLFIKGEQGDFKETHLVEQSEGDPCAWKKCIVQDEPINKTCKRQYDIEEKDNDGKTNDPDLKLKEKDSLWMQPYDDQHESEVPWSFTEESVDQLGEENITHSVSYLEETSDENGELERNTSVSVAAIDGGSPLTYNQESIALTEEFTVVVEEQIDENIDKNENYNIFIKEAIEIEVHGAETTLWQLGEETELEASRGEESDFKNDIHIRREPETYFDEISVITKENLIQEDKVSAKEKQTADNIGAVYSMTMPDVQNYRRLEGTDKFEDCSSGTCERLSGLENVVCEQILEQLPEHNNGKWQNEDTTHRILKIGDYERVTTQLREEVERVEADFINSNSEAEHLSLKDLMEEQPDSKQKAIGVSDLHNYMENNPEMVKEGHTEFLGETEKPLTIAQEPGCSLVPGLELVIGSMQTEVIQSKKELDNAAKNKTQKADFGLSEQTEESTKTLRLDGELDEVCGPEIKLATMFENGSVIKTDKNKSAQRRRNGKEFSEDTKSLETNYHKMTEAFSYNECLDAELQNMDTYSATIETGPESLQVIMEKDVKTNEREQVEKENMLSETVKHYHTEILNVATKTTSENLIELSGERIETEYTLKPNVQGESVETEEAVSNKLSETDMEQKTIESQLSNKSMDRERDSTALVLVKTVSEKRGETEVKIIEKSAAVEPVIETNAKQTDAKILDMWIEAVFSKDTDHTFKGESKEIDEAPNLLGKPICELRSSTETEDNNALPETTRTTMTKIELFKDIEARLLPESETGLWINPQTDIGDILTVDTEAGLSETSSDKLAKAEGALPQLTGIRLCVDTHETEEGTLEIAETYRPSVLRSESPELFETKVVLTEDKVIKGPLVIDKAVPRILDNYKTADHVASIDTNIGLLEDRDNDLTETKRQIFEVGFSEAVWPDTDTELQTKKEVKYVDSEPKWHQPLEENNLVEAAGIKAEFPTDLQRCFRKDSIEIRCEPAAETVPSTQEETQQIFSGLHNENEAMVVQESSESEVLLLERVVTTKSSLLVDSDFEKPQEERSEHIEKIDAISPQDEVAKAQVYLQRKTIPEDTDPHLRAYPLDFTAQKFRISIKSRHIRPPKEPRRLLQMPSVEPSHPNSSDCKPVKGIASNPLRGMGIGIKLPGLQAGFPILKKRQAESSETKQEEHDDSTKQEAAEQKPKWMPPKNPGFGNPLMSELKNKLKKTTKEL